MVLLISLDRLSGLVGEGSAALQYKKCRRAFALRHMLFYSAAFSTTGPARPTASLTGRLNAMPWAFLAMPISL